MGSALLGALRGLYQQVWSAQLGHTVTLMFFSHLVHQPLRFFDSRRTGEITTRVGDMRAAVAAVTKLIETLITSGTHVVLIPPVLFAVNWRLALVALLPAPLAAVSATLIARLLRPMQKRLAEAQADLHAQYVEVLGSIRTVKLTASEPVVYGQVRRATHHLMALQLRTGVMTQAGGILQSTIRAGGAALYTWYGWSGILDGALTLGEYLAFSGYVGYMLTPVNQLMGLVTGTQQSAITLARAFEYLDAEPEIPPVASESDRAPVGRRLEGPIVFREVSFAYADGRRALEDMDLTIPGGRMTAIVGPSGAGKSTIVRLLCRLDEPDAGRITVGGQDLTVFDRTDLRRQVAAVWQEHGLFRGTLRDNILFGAERSEAVPLQRAIEICQLEELIATLPNGLDTTIEEAGHSLSAGQRQRVLLARACMRDAELLILDEATANVDVATEDRILSGLFAAMRGRTVVFITHRIVNARYADHIIVLERGRTMQAGSHDMLARSAGLYADLLEAATERAA